MIRPIVETIPRSIYSKDLDVYVILSHNWDKVNFSKVRTFLVSEVVKRKNRSAVFNFNFYMANRK